MMQETRTARRTRTTRERIFAAAMELFARCGVARVSMQQIADKADTARSTVFKHYPKKNDLLSAFFLQFADDMLKNAKARGGDGLRQGMMAIFLATQQEALKVESILGEVAAMTLGNGPLAEEEATADNHLIVHISRLIKRGIELGEVKSTINVHETAHLLLAVITATNHEAITHNRISHLAKEHMKRFDMVFQGVGCP